MEEEEEGGEGETEEVTLTGYLAQVKKERLFIAP